MLSQAKEFEEPNHDHISVQWWNTYYQVAGLSSSNKQFDVLEKAVKNVDAKRKRRTSCKIRMV